MKHLALARRLAGALLLLAPLASLAARSIEVSSPDRQLRVTIDTGERLAFAVSHRGVPLVLPTTIGMTLSGIGTLGEKPRLTGQQRRSVDVTVRPVVAQKSRLVRDHYNALQLDFAGGYALEVRAYDEGVAYRFRTSLPGQVTVEDEQAGVNVRPQDTLYWPQEKSMQSHNEHYYQPLPMAEAAGKLVGVPALVQGGGAHLVFTESGLRDYPGLYLRGEATGLRATFPKVALAETARDDRNVPVTQEASYIARTEGKRAFPWRILGIAADAGGLLLNQMPYLLAEPQQLQDTAWIKPGKVAWDWYNGNKLYNVPFQSGLDTRTYRHYIDFAADNGLEYIIMDEGWYKLGDLLAVKPEIDMPALMDHARQRGVGIILWVSWKTLDSQMTAALDQFARWGAAGIKVDFMQRSDQWMVNYYERVAREAAARRLLVDFHGSFKPSGLQRTWPNVLTFEGVKGLENNKWSDRQTPEHDVTLPFIRMFAGPIDYTPGAMSNAHRKDFVASFDRPMSQGTRAHQLAMYVVYESPLQMLADSPSQYRANVSSLEFIRQVPVEWDESRVLHAQLGRYVAMARRRGDTWYVGAMTGADGRELALDLSFLGEGEYQLEGMEDGPNAAVFATDVRKFSSSVTRASKLATRMAPGGGWAAIIRKSAPAAMAARAALAFTPRWQIDGDGIRWQVKDAHRDQLEMSGRQVSAVIDYGSGADGSLLLSRTVVWPMLRTIPDDTHASLIRKFGAEASPALEIDGAPVPAEHLQQVRFDGRLALQSQLAPGLTLTRTLTPSPDEPALVERLELANSGKTPRRYKFAALERSETTPAGHGTHGAYVVEVRAPAREGLLAPGARMQLDVITSGRLQNEMVYVDGEEALQARARKVAQWRGDLVLETPDPVLDAMFAFSKVRAAESIFATRGGLLHGPGGTRYYAAIWANDQAEYVNPFFPYLGDRSAVQSALTSFGMFARYMNADYKPIPSSIVAEGRSYWNGAGDRGDCAMISYGASQFALAQGDSGIARQLLPLIDWCLEFTRRKRDAQGIVHSDSDELEGRFPAGKANLSTNVLAYGGLEGAARLVAALGDSRRAAELKQEAQQQRSAIERHFGARMAGYDTYRYYDGNEKLRAWIALPLALGINERQHGTVDALLSPQLWTENGVLTEAGDKTFWDRATLYALRGLLKAGELERTMPYLRYYSSRRLLGDHVPYAVEAWPEGQQRHLSAESGLYARVITEGLFGIEAASLRSFTIAPRLPQGWPRMALRRMRAFGAGEAGSGIDIATTRTARGQQVQVHMDGKLLLDQAWDGKAPLLVTIPN